MERVMSVEERIRRAEERYNRKIGQTRNYQEDTTRISKQSKKKTKRKYIYYIIICLLVYVIFYAISNSEYVFSDYFKNDVNSFFTEKTKIYEIYSNCKSYIENTFFNKKSEKENEDKIKNQKEEETQSNDNSENVGGAEELPKEQEVIENESAAKTVEQEKTQMEKDVEEIKEKISFINPLEGRISSTFGWRNPTNPNVPKYHTGLDIAAVTGTIIKSATDGVVEIASSEGDYGKHYYIKNDNVTIIYGHCSKLYLKQGETVKQGQEIAEVGNTGISTGPHLHIGIKIDDRWVDPQLILTI